MTGQPENLEYAFFHDYIDNPYDVMCGNVLEVGTSDKVPLMDIA